MLIRSPLPCPPCAPFTEADARRFWAKVQIGAPGECWRWTASRGGPGYGHAWIEIDRERRCIDAHKFAFLLACGPVPPGSFIMHECNRKDCCNPRHLRLGSPSDNARAALRDGLLKTKIAPADVLAVLRERQAGRLIVEIAGRRGVRAEHVRRILTGQHWSAVTGVAARRPAPSGEQLAQLALALEVRQ